MTQHPGAPWRRLAGTVVCTGLMACASTTEPPETPTLGLSDTTRFEAAPADAPDAQLADLRWWQRFDDPALANWVERAIAQNPDIAVANTGRRPCSPGSRDRAIAPQPLASRNR